MPTADMQWRARMIAMQASKLAEQARPATKRFATTARQGADGAARWARPRVGQARSWMAARAARGSVSVQEKVAPQVSAMLSDLARRLEPPRVRSRRWPKVLAGLTILAAGGAAAGSAAMRGRQRAEPIPMPPRPPAEGVADQQSAVRNPSAEGEHAGSEAEVSDFSRTHT